jgi:hypothetical protein
LLSQWSLIKISVLWKLIQKFKIPFEVVYVNIGGGWSPTGNAFTATVGGFYEFTASIVCAGSSEAFVYGHIVHSYGINKTRVATMLSRENGVGDSAASSVIIELQQGDYVSVQLQSGDGWITSSANNIWSTFSGYLLFT